MAITTNLFNYNYSTFIVDFSVSKLNGLTWGENYAGSSGLSAAKRPADLMSARNADAVKVSCIVLKLLKHFVNIQCFRFDRSRNKSLLKGSLLPSRLGGSHSMLLAPTRWAGEHYVTLALAAAKSRNAPRLQNHWL